jgi:hypothetical protein
MTDETKNQQGEGKKGDATKKQGSTVESKHVNKNTGGPKTEAGLPGQGQKGENEREDSKPKAS